MSARRHYRPRLTWRPIVAVRWRSHGHEYQGEEVRLRWALYLFGVLPIARLPRRPTVARS